MENEYTNKYTRQIKDAFEREQTSFERADEIRAIVDQIYQDGFIDGTNEANITNGVEPEDNE